MKTLVLFEEVPEQSYFYEVDGNYSHLNGVYVNSTLSQDSDIKELLNLIYDNNGCGNKKLIALEQPTKDWDVFIKCGFIL